jgi:tetratricopeptide (TPR) repeat protein
MKDLEDPYTLAHARRQPRRRAVRLTNDATEALKHALTEKWRADKQTGKLTREVRAEILGVSVATSERLLSGKGVDRSTISVAFRNVGLEYSDKVFEPLVPEDDALPPDQQPMPEVNHPQTRHKWSRFVSFVLAASVLLAVVMTTVKHPASASGKPVTADWATRFNIEFAEASNLYHEAKFAEAQKRMDSAMDIARSHDSAGQFSGALRLAGDLQAAHGAFRQAKDSYSAALKLRGMMHQDTTLPPILEALGDVETKMGDYASARMSLTQALNGYTNGKDRVGIAMTARDLGTLSFDGGDNRCANLWLETSLQALHGLSKMDLEADVRARKALVIARQSRLDEARTALCQCLQYWTMRGHPRWIAVSEYQLGTVESAAHRFPKAAVLLSRSLSGFEKLGDEDGAVHAKLALARLGPRIDD